MSAHDSDRRHHGIRISIASVIALTASLLVAFPASAIDASPIIVDIESASPARQIAIDGERVLTTEVVGTRAAIAQRIVSFDDQTAPAEPTVVRTPTSASSCTAYTPAERCTAIVAANGVTAWRATPSMGYSDGTRGSEQYVTGRTMVSPTAVSGPWILLNDAQLVNFTTKTVENVVPLVYSRPTGGADLLDGTLYRPGLHRSTFSSSVLLRDLETGASSSISLADRCSSVSRVQANGGWLLVTCTTTDASSVFVVVDRTGAVPVRVLPSTGERLVLGNGFVVRRSETDTIDWAPLDDTAPDAAALDWRELGALATTDGSIAVSKGDVASVAWIDPDGGAHAALLPVTPTSTPAQVDTVAAAPGAPVLTTETRAYRIEATWAAPAESDRVTGYLVSGGKTTSTLLPASARSFSFAGLSNGSTHSVSVTAINAAGATAAQSGNVVVISDEPGYVSSPWVNTNTYDGVVTVDWEWRPADYSDELLSFTIESGSYRKTGIDPAARTWSFKPREWLGGKTLTITAVGPRGGAPKSTTVWADTRPDERRPSTSVVGLAKVTTATSHTAVIDAWDNREVKGYTVRTAYAAPGKTMGAWSYPSAWAGLTDPLALKRTGLKRGYTYCYSVKATDISGLASSWSDSYCSVVALDDKSLKHNGSTKTVKSSGYLGGSATQLKTSNSSMTINVNARNMWVIATTCPTCGEIGFQRGGATYSYSLKSKKTVKNAVVQVNFNRYIYGTYKIVRMQGTGPVTVDGFAAQAR